MLTHKVHIQRKRLLVAVRQGRRSGVDCSSKVVGGWEAIAFLLLLLAEGQTCLVHALTKLRHALPGKAAAWWLAIVCDKGFA